MERAVIFALIASFCTATSSVCQRMGARATPNRGFSLTLLFRLATQPIWLAGVGSMILGFVFQLIALRNGELALVQPILATELLFVFGYMTRVSSVTVTRRDWLAAAAMAAGLGGFLFVAEPHGGRLHAPGTLWWLAAIATGGFVLLMTTAALGTGRRQKSSARRAALLGIATGASWGFVAAVIKELSSHLGGGFTAVFSNWSPYVVVGAGAVSMLLASHALQAGPLAASQPGFTIVDPLAASLLGVFIFGEHVRTGILALALQALCLLVLSAGATALSHSHLVQGVDPTPAEAPDPVTPGLTHS